MNLEQPTYGVQAVEELLRAGRRAVRELLILPGRHQGPLARIRQTALERSIPVVESDRARLGRLELFECLADRLLIGRNGQCHQVAGRRFDRQLRLRYHAL